MQDSESPVLRLSGKGPIHIYDKNITNKIQRNCHRCHISDPGGYPYHHHPFECQHENEMSNPESLNFKGIFKKMPSAFQKQNSSRNSFFFLQHQQSKILDHGAFDFQWPRYQHGCGLSFFFFFF